MISTWQVALCAALVGLTTAAPTAVIANGTVIGSSNNGVDSFMGIPYAIPPTSTRRLTNPTALNSKFSGNTFIATGTPTACPGYIKATPTGLAAAIESVLAESPLVQAATHTGEDCLNLNVQRSSSTVTSSSKVPVLVYIYGGGFESGSTAQYDGTPFIKKADTLGHPIVYVAMSYRLAGLGFLPGAQMAGVANLGLKDQRLALQWIHDNIAAFGGDSAKVTIWGESAGSVSVFDHLVINGGDNTFKGTPLFVGAIMNSGSIFPAQNISSPGPQSVYDTLVQNAGCGTTNSLACLRGLSSGAFISAMETLPAIFDYQSLHLAYFPRPDPSDKFYPTSPEVLAYGGKYAKVPIIIGDMEDEATFFSLVQQNITDQEGVITYLHSYFPESGYNTDLPTFVGTWGNNGTVGSPFNTGELYELYAEYKTLAAILGDIFFTLTRRLYLEFVANNGGVKTWTYLNTYLYGFPYLGSFHGADTLNDRISPAPYSQTAQDAVQQYYISFANYQDPNTITPMIQWPTWTTSGLQMLNFSKNATEIITDSFRPNQYQALKGYIGKLHL